MANVAATIARNGVWMRPRLVAPEDAGRFSTRPSETAQPDRIDLHLAPQALGAVQTGMREVCTATKTGYGTGYMILPESIERGPTIRPSIRIPCWTFPSPVRPARHKQGD